MFHIMCLLQRYTGMLADKTLRTLKHCFKTFMRALLLAPHDAAAELSPEEFHLAVPIKCLLSLDDDDISTSDAVSSDTGSDSNDSESDSSDGFPTRTSTSAGEALSAFLGHGNSRMSKGGSIKASRKLHSHGGLMSPSASASRLHEQLELQTGFTKQRRVMHHDSEFSGRTLTMASRKETSSQFDPRYAGRMMKSTLEVVQKKHKVPTVSTVHAGAKAAKVARVY